VYRGSGGGTAGLGGRGVAQLGQKRSGPVLAWLQDGHIVISIFLTHVGLEDSCFL
jgi:hypothetical protein